MILCLLLKHLLANIPYSFKGTQMPGHDLLGLNYPPASQSPSPSLFAFGMAGASPVPSFVPTVGGGSPSSSSSAGAKNTKRPSSSSPTLQAAASHSPPSAYEMWADIMHSRISIQTSSSASASDDTEARERERLLRQLWDGLSPAVRQDIDDGERLVRKAIELDPKCAISYFSLGLLLLR